VSWISKTDGMFGVWGLAFLMLWLLLDGVSYDFWRHCIFMILLPFFFSFFQPAIPRAHGSVGFVIPPCLSLGRDSKSLQRFFMACSLAISLSSGFAGFMQIHSFLALVDENWGHLRHRTWRRSSRFLTRIFMS